MIQNPATTPTRHREALLQQGRGDPAKNSGLLRRDALRNDEESGATHPIYPLISLENMPPKETNMINELLNGKRSFDKKRAERTEQNNILKNKENGTILVLADRRHNRQTALLCTQSDSENVRYQPCG